MLKYLATPRLNMFDLLYLVALFPRPWWFLITFIPWVVLSVHIERSFGVAPSQQVRR